MKNRTKKAQAWYKKWWIWVIVAFSIAYFGSSNKQEQKNDISNQSPKETELVSKDDTSEKNNADTQQREVITLDKNSEFRRILTLNKDTDLPNDEILYKVPVGKYKVTTNFNKVATFAVVKDHVNIIEGNYPEELSYVSELFNVTNKPEDYDTKLAKPEAFIEVADDESISVPNDDTLFLERQ